MVKKLYETKPRDIVSNLFMVLDEKSVESRTVVLISKSSRTLYSQVVDDEVRYDGIDDIVWRKHCIPFEEVAFFWSLILAKPGDEGDDFLQSTAWRSIDGL